MAFLVQFDIFLENKFGFKMFSIGKKNTWKWSKNGQISVLLAPAAQTKLLTRCPVLRPVR